MVQCGGFSVQADLALSNWTPELTQCSRRKRPNHGGRGWAAGPRQHCSSLQRLEETGQSRVRRS